MMKWKSPAQCELCRRDLGGSAEIESSINEGVVSVTVKESLVIDWVFCRLCQSVVCRASCFEPATGFCRACGQTTGESGATGRISDIFSLREPSSPSPAAGDEILAAEMVF